MILPLASLAILLLVTWLCSRLDARASRSRVEERALIGALLYDHSLVAAVACEIESALFRDHQLASIYDALMLLHEEGERVAPENVVRELESRGECAAARVVESLSGEATPELREALALLRSIRDRADAVA